MAFVGYRIFFYDFSDFMEGCTRFFSRRRRGWETPPAEYFEDSSWSSGFRFFIFLAFSVGSGYLAYHGLLKIFG